MTKILALWTIIFMGCTQQNKTSDIQKPVETTKSTPVDAVTSAAKAIKSAPNFENYISYGLALQNASRHEEAVEAYQMASKINPSAAVAHNDVCAAYNSLKRWALALPACSRAVELQPSFQLAKNNLAFASSQKIEREKAINDLIVKLSQIKKVGEKDGALVQIGMQYYDEGEYRKSIDYWQKIPAKSPQRGTSLNNIASAMILMKEFDGAEKNIREAIKLDPKNRLFQNNLEWLERARASSK